MNVKQFQTWAVVIAASLFLPAAGFAQGWGGMMGGGYGNGGSYHGMMGGNGGYGYGGSGMMGWSGQGNTPQGLGMERLSMNDAKNDVAQYLAGSGQPNLVIGEIMEFDRNFYALVKEKDTGRGAFELIVDPYSGRVTPEPGPNMMWNTKYGHMGQWSQNAPTMTVSVEQARQNAQTYLNSVGPGYTVEEHPDVFYGYYTAHVLKGGKIVGMLGINGSTGQVWFHSWHGTYRAMESMD